jgi:prepilin-type N-terminal cleavage/methylation domain-containing protein
MGMSSTPSVSLGVGRGVGRAFTLIEVLIGILILGLGLLGLGAVFPAVVVQQRGAADAVEGSAVSDAAAAWLKGHQQLNFRSRLTQIPGGTGQPQPQSLQGGWETALWNEGGALLGEVPFDGGWDLENPLMGMDTATGEVSIGQGASAVLIPARERLLPRDLDASNPLGFGQSRFVWDAVARRFPRVAPPNTTNEPGWQRQRRLLQDRVEVAVFVRRVDVGIRPRTGRTYVPVAEIETTAQPTLEGEVGGTTGAVYSRIRNAELAPYLPGNRQQPIPNLIREVIIQVEGDLGGLSSDLAQALMAQVGQKFLLNNGQVVTVTSVSQVEGPNNGADRIMRVEPGIPSRDFNGMDGDTNYANIAVLFTPQIPVAIKTFLVNDAAQ